ncbi:uncharacterized protein LOC119591829 [Penaeus monodon]|uniref:uncharacterized protein LOC119591829 n=1 Tax=Penaeus monodon TaxID=6687 RepID=UPI0018A70DE5|nr:uncharacterized protein LOC119591829 [Penaeus monodon]
MQPDTGARAASRKLRRQLTTNCTFNGTAYPDGATLDTSCLILTCVEGIWRPTGLISNNCSMCTIRNDPHFTDFDRCSFDFHGTSEYCVAMNVNAYGVTAGFYQCNSFASCLDVVTYKDDVNTVITFNRNGGDTVTKGKTGIVGDREGLSSNGDPFTVTNFVQNVESAGGVVHPVLAWKDTTSCIRMIGTRGLALKFCSYMLYVWAQTDILGDLKGLCLSGRAFNVKPTGYFQKLPVSKAEINMWGESLLVSDSSTTTSTPFETTTAH